MLVKAARFHLILTPTANIGLKQLVLAIGFSYALQPYKQDVAGSKPAPGILTSTAITSFQASLGLASRKMVGTLQYFT